MICEAYCFSIPAPAALGERAHQHERKVAASARSG
jgi:hypothetical protein